MKTIFFRLLNAEDTEIVLASLLNTPDNYNQYFTPFKLQQDEIFDFLAAAQKDSYWGIFEGEKLAGFHFLRGLDAGYDIPSYGVWIAPEYANLGLAQLTLSHALAFCKLNRIHRLMLKVHPHNAIAKNIYHKFGFEKTGFDPKNGNLIYHKSLE